VLLSSDDVNWATSVLLTFTPANYSTPQQLYVKAADDAASEGIRTVELQYVVAGELTDTVQSATSSSLTFASAALIPTGLAVVGGTVTLTSGSGAGEHRTITAVSGQTLTLDRAWTTLPVAGDGFAIRSVGEYDALALADTPVELIDNEQVGVAVLQNGNSLQVVEGGAPAIVAPTGQVVPGNSFQVWLTQRPLGTVTVTLANPDGYLTLSSTTLTFNSTTWNTAQTVTVSAADDHVVQGYHYGYITTSVSASGDVFTGTANGTPATSKQLTASSALFPTTIANPAGGYLDLRGFEVKIVGGTGAGQVRTIHANTASTLTVQEPWDVLPDATSQFVVDGYESPVSTQAVGGPVSSATSTTLTTSVTLPTTRGGLSGATVRIVSGTGAGLSRTVASNTASTLTVQDPWGVVPDTTSVFGVVEIPGVTVPRVQVGIGDADTPGVLVTQTDGSTRLIEGRTDALGKDTYFVSLTKAPSTDVYVRVTPQLTPTSSVGLLTISPTDPNVHMVKVAVACADTTTTSSCAVQTDGTLLLHFTSTNYQTAQGVVVSAANDGVVEGGAIKAFAAHPQRVNQIQGPLFVSGTDDPIATTAIPPPVLLPGESTSALPIPSGGTLQTIESKQVDTLNVNNQDSPSADTGDLTSTRITGLTMGADTFVAGRLLPGGITYDNLEAVNVNLGYGNNTFTVESTATGTTSVAGGAGNDTFNVRTLSGPTKIDGGPGNDVINVGSQAPATSGGVIDSIGSLLALYGGSGSDTVNVDDTANIHDKLGSLD
jgi:hypothetical protein